MIGLPRPFGRYVLQAKIGEGGMAEIYAATLTLPHGLSKQVVIKKVREHLAERAELDAMLTAEARVALPLTHPNIVHVFDFGEVEGAPYMAMEYVDGPDLMRLFRMVRKARATPSTSKGREGHSALEGREGHSALEGRESFPPAFVAYILHQAASGLAYAHGRTDDDGRRLGIVHRDISPHNIVVSREGHVKLLDFGIAKTRGLERSHPEPTIKGKIAYMSPEQANGLAVDARSDVHALGVVAYELLSGKLLFRSKDRSVALERVRSHRPLPLTQVAPHVPPQLAQIVARAMEREPMQRYPTAQALEADLAAYLRHTEPAVDAHAIGTFVAAHDPSIAKVPGPRARAARAVLRGPDLPARTDQATLGSPATLPRPDRFAARRPAPPTPARLERTVVGELAHATPVRTERVAPTGPTPSTTVRPDDRSSSSPLVGRPQELAVLRARFSATIEASTSQRVAVLGTRGVGRRSLLERFAALLPRRSCWILHARGHRDDGSRGVFFDLIVQFLVLHHTDSLPSVLAKLQLHGIAEPEAAASALLAALRAQNIDVGGRDSDLDARCWALASDLVQSLARRRPVLFIASDIERYDPPAFDRWLAWLEREHPIPILIAITGQGVALRRALSVRPGAVAHLELRDLPRDLCAPWLLEQFEPSADARAFVSRMLDHTGGNPMFIEETLRAVLETGALQRNPADGRLLVSQPSTTFPIPESIETALRETLDELAPNDRHLLDAAAVLGPSLRARELRDLANLDSETALGVAIARAWLVLEARGEPSGDRLRFRTESLYRVCWTHLPETKAKALHADAAALLHARDDYAPLRDGDAVARHLVLAGQSQRAIEHSLASAALMDADPGNQSAYRHLTVALRTMDEHHPDRWAALLRREAILRVWGQRQAQRADLDDLVTIAERSGDRVQRTTAATRLLRFHVELAQIVEAQALLPQLEDHLQQIPDAKPFAAAVGELKSILHVHMGQLALAREAADAALACCDAIDDGERQRCCLLDATGQVLIAQREWVRARSCYEHGLALAKRIGDQRLAAQFMNGLGEALVRSGDPQRALQLFLGALALDRTLGDRYATGRKLGNAGLTCAWLGMHAAAERYFRSALELHRATDDPAGFDNVAIEFGRLLGRRGDRAAAQTWLVRAARAAAKRDDERTKLRAEIFLAEVMASPPTDSGHQREARTLAGQVLRTARSLGLRTPQSRALYVLSVVFAESSDPARAIALGWQAVDLVRKGAAPLDAIRFMSHLLGLLEREGRRDDALRLREESRAWVDARCARLTDPRLLESFRAEEHIRRLLSDAPKPLAIPSYA